MPTQELYRAPRQARAERFEGPLVVVPQDAVGGLSISMGLTAAQWNDPTFNAWVDLERQDGADWRFVAGVRYEGGNPIKAQRPYIAIPARLLRGATVRLVIRPGDMPGRRHQSRQTLLEATMELVS